MFRVAFFNKICFRKINSVCNLVQLEQIRKFVKAQLKVDLRQTEVVNVSFPRKFWKASKCSVE